MPDHFKYLSPGEFEALSRADKERYLNALNEHLHGLPRGASATARPDLVDYCPFCGAFLCRIYGSSGERSADSATVISGKHGRHSTCLNPACKRRIELAEIDGAWMVAPVQSKD